MVPKTRRSVAADSLGARLREARLERGMSQAQLAGEELTKGFISQLESGAVRPSIRSLQVIASRLGKSLDYFLGDEPLSVQKRAEFFQLAAQAASERADWQELARIAQEAQSLELEPHQRAHFLRWQAQARLGAGDSEGAFAAVDEALRATDVSRDPGGYAWVLLVQGVAYANIGQLLPASQTFERALTAVNEHEVLDARLRTRLLMNLATTYRRLNRTTKAVQLYESALGLANRSSDIRAVAQALMGVAVGLYDSGELDGAIAHYRRALELFRRVADQHFELSVLHSLAAVRYQQGEVEQAAEYARQCHERAIAVGDEHMAAVAQVELARVALAGGDHERAIAAAAAAEAVLARAGDAKQRASALRTIGAAEHATRRHDDADRHYQQAIELAQSIQMYPDVSEFSAEYAQKLRERGEYERAFQYLELARRNAGTPAPQ